MKHNELAVPIPQADEFISADSAQHLGKPELPTSITGFPDFGHIPLKHCSNVRDLGGLQAFEGRPIKHFKLIRSDALHHLSADDADELLNKHQLKRIVDFRTEIERDAEPDDMKRLTGVTEYCFPVFKEEAVGITHGKGLLDELQAASNLMHSPFVHIRDLYGTMMVSDEGRKAYRALLDLLLEADEGATLWHCTEGKDRAGMGSYVVEQVLGVSDEDCRKDYLATNLFARNGMDRMVDLLARHGLAKTLAREIDSLFYAYNAYLDAALESVEREFGTFEGYIEEGLGFDPDKAHELREKYLV